MDFNRYLGAALAAFPYEGKIAALEPFGSGHINDTYAVYVETPGGGSCIGYILQRLNTNVFKKPGEVMENIIGVTGHLHRALERCGEDCERGTLHFVKTNEGAPAYIDGEGMPWRSYHFIKESFCYDQCPTEEIFYESARAFGRFLRLLEDYPAATLHETIPGFHHTPGRVEALREAVAADPLGRAEGCAGEIEFALARAADCCLLTDLLEKGELPLRVTHNDTKLNNVLFDAESNKALCIIDLDTIMPGLALNDFGDSIRFGATTAAEDEPDLTRVSFSLPLFEVYTKGFLETAGPSLTAKEIELLPQGARIITLECGIRFLTDHLLGDGYFKVDRPGHNLDRCRTQFKLAADMERDFATMEAIVKKYS